MKNNWLEKVFLNLVGPWIESPPRFFRRTFLTGEFRLKDPEGRKMVYLTFDDGPIPESTPWLLDTLDRLGVKATFFMVGDNVRKYPRLHDEVLARGHSVGNHTMHHLNAAKVMGPRYIHDVEEAAGYIDSGLLRPPHGWMQLWQRVFLCDKYRIIMYDLVTRDYSKYVSAERVFDNVRKYSRPGSVIVFHDSLKSIDKLRLVLPRCIEWLRSEGYEFGIIPSRNPDK